jgi:hypothetical protein
MNFQKEKKNCTKKTRKSKQKVTKKKKIFELEVRGGDNFDEANTRAGEVEEGCLWDGVVDGLARVLRGVSVRRYVF